MINKEFDIQQLVQYLTGNCSEEEQKQVEMWIASSNDNLLLFDELKKVWNSSSITTEKYSVDVDRAWAEFKSRAGFSEDEVVNHVAEPEVRNVSKRKKILYYCSRVAAVAVIIFGIYFLLNKGSNIKMYNYTAAAVQVDSPVVLSDGSSVIMNKNARINYPEEFTSESRNISFKGEAFFDIAHNPDKPFIISTGNVKVKVLGTSFDLQNNIDEDFITVYLESGKILFYSIDEIDGSILEQIILHPGEKGIYNKNTGLITKDKFENNNHIAWKTGSLEFVNAPLSDVVRALESAYNITVKSDIALSNYQITARFDNESVISIFESLQIIYGFDYNIDNDIVLIY